MIAACMLSLDPTVHIGGNSKALDGNFRIGSDRFFITEACEYKRSFLRIRPDVAVVLNIDADHLDYYRDIDDVSDAFLRFCLNVPKSDGLIVVYNGDERAVDIAKRHGAKVLTVGYEGADVYASETTVNGDGACSFDAHYPGLSPVRIALKVAGKHNVLNALAAVAVAVSAGVDLLEVKAALEDFEGALRRWQTLGETNGAKVIADYAHHPKEIKAVFEMARSTHPQRLITVFQPHTYSRTEKLWDDFVETLSASDVLILTPIYAAREASVSGISSEALAKEIGKRNFNTHYASNFANLSYNIQKLASPGDLILILGAGDIIEAGESIVREWEERR
jgi:UDP-N-acetylmuramate--alanine ligase